MYFNAELSVLPINKIYLMIADRADIRYLLAVTFAITKREYTKLNDSFCYKIAHKST